MNNEEEVGRRVDYSDGSVSRHAFSASPLGNS